ARRRDRALLMADRSGRRDERSEIAVDVPPPAPVTATLGCRTGLAPLLAEELAALGMAPARRGDAVEVAIAGPWSALFASRLWATAAIELPLDRAARGGDPDAIARAIVGALTAPATRALLRAWTRGAIRWRLGFTSGHKRAIVWRVARDVTAAAPELINDPTTTTWDVRVDEARGALALIPRRLDDPRFAWRVAEVPAASHPTVAAALAWLAEARPGDRVWDPFCGSGAELIERARRGPVRALHGSDLDAAALDAARANLGAAAITAELVRADARHHAPGPVELILTNPPLGSRVQVDAAALLCEALPNLARQLAPGGRLVWITPAPRQTTPVAERLGLRCARSLAVDLGGVRGRLERWDRPKRS
ncbi:MAG: TRM11 family SAM-dependent methyltransferase, partial [Kofleriaceae bacterium]